MSVVGEIIDGIRLDTFSSTPLYQQLSSNLRERIASGELEVGTHLPTENELSRALGIGVSTVRSAYAQLVKEGIVTRRPRRGSFVSSPELGRQIDGLYSFSAETRRMGKKPSTRVLSFERQHPTREVAEHLGVTPGQEVFRIVRLRLADDNIVMLETSYVPVEVCPTLTGEDVKASLYDAITRVSGSAPAVAHEAHEAIVLDKQQAKVLDRMTGDPAFLITRTTQNAKGETFEYCISVCPGDTTHYEMTLRPDGANVSKLQQ